MCLINQDSIGGLNLGFPGQYYDAERGLWNNGFRDYNASLGRYIEYDPTGLSGSINGYAYVGGNPLSLTDSLGLCPSQRCLNALKTAGQSTQALQNVSENWNTIVSAAADNGIDPALLAAVGVRETGFNNIAQVGGGQGAGVFQIDLGANHFVSSSQAYNINYSANFAAGMLAHNMQTIAALDPNFTHDELMHATAASYNLGPFKGGISGNPNTIDIGSAHNNYGQNVIDLMNCFDY
ncbi:RHS repeat-associated core domain-containing protein [Fulvimonas sp. R45]|uniref:RHS repeat-associated core domain-containing protein n=1 Tax=Fulvimonas sp. R45 TaxID=3045937 RepID=UPI00265EC220|nr:RHS repeat-associated core domain-containing protein [Fulvimonas sp. R45]MDO1527975.1 RHS repeat-associated core domain-containing protein [Fulvimonas sp. R45]